MTYFSSFERPSANLSRVLQDRAKTRFERLESEILDDIKRKVRGGEKLTNEERRRLNERNARKISEAFDGACETVIKQTKVKSDDSVAEIRAKAGIAEEVTGFIQKMSKFITDKVTSIVSSIGYTISMIGQEIKSLFKDLWSYITG